MQLLARFLRSKLVGHWWSQFRAAATEAKFRFAAVDLRSHAEHVALYRGEHHQKNILNGLFGGTG